MILWPPLGRPQAKTRSRTNVLDVNSSHLDHLQGTELLPCDWVACLQPPQAPAYTHLRHTGWWGFKRLLKSEMIHICQVWRPHPIRRECQFCLWEGNGFWGGLPSNILWSDMSGKPHYLETIQFLKFFDQDGSESGSKKGYFLVPEDDEWPNCVRGDHSFQINRSGQPYKNLKSQVHYVVLHLKFHLRGI